MSRWIVCVVVGIACLGCLKLGDGYQKLPPGIWRGVLVLGDEMEGFDEKTKGELPFNFEVVYDGPDSFHIVIHNGEERIVVRDIRTGVDRRTARDTIWIDFPVYDSHIQAQFEEDAIEGWWVVRNRKDYRIKFKALHAQDYRFFRNPEPPVADVTGRWACRFGIEGENPNVSIGEFKQEGNRLTGTFINPTGDDRFLEGTVSGDRMFLSVFDGTHAYLYEAKITGDNQLSGIYRSGNHFKTYWEATRNDTLTAGDLADPYAMTSLRNKDERFSVAFPDPDGKMVSLEDPLYAGKPKIIQIMGTWCPNCRDETDFLLDYLQKHPNPGFEILGISFERHTDNQKAKAAIRTYKDKMNIPYTLVYGGSSNKDSASVALPMLDKVIAFPTLLFLDKNDRVVASHTGFAGPATSGYAEFKMKFDELVSQMMKVDE